MYGQGAGYNTMKHKFRGYRKMAEDLRAVVASGDPNIALRPQPRTPHVRSTANAPPTNTGSGKKTKGKPAKASKITEDPPSALITIDSDSDAVSSLKDEIKTEVERTRGLLGIKKHRLDDLDDLDDDHDETPKRPRFPERSPDCVDRYLDSPMKLPSMGLKEKPLVDSQTNGYILSTADLSITDVPYEPFPIGGNNLFQSSRFPRPRIWALR